MTSNFSEQLSTILSSHEQSILAEWLKQLGNAGQFRDGRITEAETKTQAMELLGVLVTASRGWEPGKMDTSQFSQVRSLLETISRSRALKGFSSKDTATFVFSMKQAIFNQLKTNIDDKTALVDAIWALNELLDDLGLFTVEVYQKSREEVINRQNLEIAELSTPVVSLWDGIVALPLIGTLDSSRTQTVMENLLNAIIEKEAEIAIIDITGVPTVDTLVAQHLLKTVAAARLMGADCIISGIRPQIAQTMVHLGVDLKVTTKATLAGAFKIALQRTGQSVGKASKPDRPTRGEKLD